jgi:hypothetical protein
MQTLLSKAFVASVTVASLGLLAAPQANAAVIAGSSLSFSGQSSTTLPGNTATPLDFTVDNATLSFAGATSYTFNPGSFTFTPDGPPFFTSNAFDFTVIGGTSNGKVISFAIGDYIKISGGTTFFSPVAQLTGTDTDGVNYTGAIFFTQSSTQGQASASYSGSFQAVPEPLTMLGASAAVAFGAAFKRRNANKG